MFCGDLQRLPGSGGHFELFGKPARKADMKSNFFRREILPGAELYPSSCLSLARRAACSMAARPAPGPVCRCHAQRGANPAVRAALRIMRPGLSSLLASPGPSWVLLGLGPPGAFGIDLEPAWGQCVSPTGDATSRVGNRSSQGFHAVLVKFHTRKKCRFRKPLALTQISHTL